MRADYRNQDVNGNLYTKKAKNRRNVTKKQRLTDFFKCNVLQRQIRSKDYSAIENVHVRLLRLPWSIQCCMPRIRLKSL